MIESTTFSFLAYAENSMKKNERSLGFFMEWRESAGIECYEGRFGLSLLYFCLKERDALALNF